MHPSPSPARALLERYATSAPRYTSYPTAVDWSRDFDGARYPELLERAARSPEPLSLYVHLPFCAELCLFCGCNVVVSRSAQRMERYVSALEREIEQVAAGGIGARPVRQYHWGGGTPTQLPLALMERVQRAITNVFRIASDAEVAIEVDPRVTTPEQVRWLAAQGFNRVSLGVQDFEPDVQRAIKRVQSEAQTRAVIDEARAAGIGSVNIDLIYGLPRQTLDGFERTVRRVLDIRPERVALFHYAHVPWMKKHQTALDLGAAPSSDLKLTIFLRALELFREAGYAYVGLDHFALPTDELARAKDEGVLQRNFMGYTTRRGGDMVSLGVSAIGEVAGAFVQNAHTEPEYLRLVAERGFATFRGHELTAEDRLRRDVIVGLMCNLVLDTHAVGAHHGVDFDVHFARELAELRSLEADGLVEIAPGSLRVTPMGQLFLRNVALPFDAYYRERQARGTDGQRTFSRTV
ncbi:MAG: oxygen-independent coproporphyrinogen III oxidase [Planctomycetes bacterium]|nr:oxygen-independent coproporphyrinogen III oxidase [Planctomycetota bacterium]